MRGWVGNMIEERGWNYNGLLDVRGVGKEVTGE